MGDHHATWCPAYVPEHRRHWHGHWKVGACNCGHENRHQATLVYEDNDCRVYHTPAQEVDHGYRVDYKPGYLERARDSFERRYGDFGLWEYLKEQIEILLR